MEYPRFVFIAPGVNKCQGGTYGNELVQDEKEHKAALDVGYSDSIPEAFEAMSAAKEALDGEEKPRRGRKPKVED